MLRRFLASEDGNYAAIFAIASFPVIAVIGGLVDFVSTNTKAAKLQNSLDAAGIAIATRYYSGMTDAELQQLGAEYFASNMFDGQSLEDLDFEYLDETDSFDVEAIATGQINFISVTSKIEHEAFLGGNASWHATRHSFVRVEPGPPACVLALSDDASDAVKIQGSTQVTLDGCVIASNSDAADAASRGGSALVSADCVYTVGGTEGLSDSNADLECGLPFEKQYPSFNPLAGIAVPAGSGCQNMPGGKTKTLSPGTYCNKTWSGNITLDPGVYILVGGKIQLGGNDILSGAGVTIFLTNGAEFSSNGNEIIQLSPPPDGPYAGITIFQAPGNTKTLSINGAATSSVEGFVYAPDAHVFYAGNSETTGAGKCLRIIGDTIEMSGTSSVSSDCEGVLGGREMNASRYITLVK